MIEGRALVSRLHTRDLCAVMGLRTMSSGRTCREAWQRNCNRSRSSAESNRRWELAFPALFHAISRAFEVISDAIWWIYMFLGLEMALCGVE